MILFVCINTNGMTRLPNEIIDKILIRLNNFGIAIKLNNEYIVKHLFNPKIHDMNYIQTNKINLKMIKYLYSIGLYLLVLQCIGHVNWVI